MDEDLYTTYRSSANSKSPSRGLPNELQRSLDLAFVHVIRQEIPTREKVTQAPWTVQAHHSEAQQNSSSIELRPMTDIQARSLEQQTFIRDLQTQIQDPSQVLQKSQDILVSGKPLETQSYEDEQVPQFTSMLQGPNRKVLSDKSRHK